jgi:hypothetical protein
MFVEVNMLFYPTYLIRSVCDVTDFELHINEGIVIVEILRSNLRAFTAG